MNAIVIRRYGGPEAMELAEMPEPMPEAEDAVVDVHAASMNPIDWKMREGRVRAHFDPPLPHILGRDFSGVIASVGSGVGDFRPGEAVFGMANPLRQGKHAQSIGNET